MSGWTCPDCGRVNDRGPTGCTCGWYALGHSRAERELARLQRENARLRSRLAWALDKLSEDENAGVMRIVRCYPTVTHHELKRGRVWSRRVPGGRRTGGESAP